MNLASTPTAPRRFELQDFEVQQILGNLDIDEDPQVASAASSVIAIAGALIACNPVAMEQAAEALRELPRSDKLLDFISAFARVLSHQVPVVSSALEQRAPAFGRLSHPAGVQAFLDRDLDLLAA